MSGNKDINETVQEWLRNSITSTSKVPNKLGKSDFKNFKFSKTGTTLYSEAFVEKQEV
jgi:hypothetical protein